MNKVTKETGSGIYKITSKITGHYYIGSAVCLNIRRNQHNWRLNKGVHHNIKMQSYCNKYGIDDFEFNVLEHCDKELLISREQYYIDLLKPELNISPTAANTLGVPCSEKTKIKIGEANSGTKSWWYGKHHTEEHKKYMSEKMKNRSFSEETRKKMSLSKQGQWAGENNPWYGKKGEAHWAYGKKGILSPSYGIKRTPEQIKRQSESQLGRKLSENTIQKMQDGITRKRHKIRIKKALGIYQ
ncbi:MAG: NUMOD3 domain-containing DNA-binding protein [Candidatus Kapaibacterium sp.]